jgi:hypothetical protein
VVGGGKWAVAGEMSISQDLATVVALPPSAWGVLVVNIHGVGRDVSGGGSRQRPVCLGSRVNCLRLGPESIDMFLPLLSAAVEIVDVDDPGLPPVIGGQEFFGVIDSVDDGGVDVVLQ